MGPEKKIKRTRKMEIKLKTNLLHTLDEIEKAGSVNNAITVTEHVAGAENSNNDYGKTLVDLWQKRHDYIKAGIGKESVLAIDGMFLVPAEYRVNDIEFGGFMRDFLRKYFGPDNVLSCVSFVNKNKDSVVHFCIYPLWVRALNPSKWIDLRTDKFNDSMLDDLYRSVSEKFGLNLAASEKITGHTQFLDEFPTVKITKEDTEEIIYDSFFEDEQIQTDLSRDQITDIINIAIEYFTTGVEKASYIKLVTGALTREAYIAGINDYLDRTYDKKISDRDKDVILNRVLQAALGFYILEPLINDDNISDIKVVSHDKIRVKVNGKRRTSNLAFLSIEDYARFLNGIELRYNLDYRTSAFHVFTDKETNPNNILRNNITTKTINSGEPQYHIRKIPKTKRDVDWLIKHEVMDKTVANYLIWAARDAKGIVFTGKGSSGKTTMMNALLEYIPSNRSGLVIQESEELFSNKPELTFQHITPDYSLKDLAKNGLLTDIDYFVIGEVKGAEAMYFINACDTGNKGWCSVHSPSSTEAIDKLADYVMYESKYDKEQALYMLKELQVVVFMKDFKVREISEITGWDHVEKKLNYKTIFKLPD